MAYQGEADEESTMALVAASSDLDANEHAFSTRFGRFGRASLLVGLLLCVFLVALTWHGNRVQANLAGVVQEMTVDDYEACKRACSEKHGGLDIFGKGKCILKCHAAGAQEGAKRAKVVAQKLKSQIDAQTKNREHCHQVRSTCTESCKSFAHSPHRDNEQCQGMMLEFFPDDCQITEDSEEYTMCEKVCTDAGSRCVELFDSLPMEVELAFPPLYPGAEILGLAYQNNHGRKTVEIDFKQDGKLLQRTFLFNGKEDSHEDGKE